MCCIFTCFGWMLDLLQRCWVFSMSCVISSAVCCVLLTSATSGIALGYNYSLAEYIELKETNVSVYIKRGVFDDEISDDMDWRRSGHKPDISGFLSDKNVITGAPDDGEQTALKSGRRLDDSIYQSESQNKYEGSLLKLTAKAPLQPDRRNEPTPPYYTATASTVTTYTDRGKLQELIDRFPAGSLDQLKAIQSVINARRAAQRGPQLIPEQTDLRRNFQPRPPGFEEEIQMYEKNFPGFPGSGGSARRGQEINDEMGMPKSRFREAVPNFDLGGWAKGAVVKANADPNDIEGEAPTFPPRPPTPKPARVLPTKPPTSLVVERYQPSRTPHTKQPPEATKAFKDDLDKFRQRLLVNQYDDPNLKAGKSQTKQPVDEEYEEEFRGAPVRKKRSINNNQNSNIETSSNIIIISNQDSSPTPAPLEPVKPLFLSNKNINNISRSNDTKEADVQKHIDLYNNISRSNDAKEADVQKHTDLYNKISQRHSIMPMKLKRNILRINLRKSNNNRKSENVKRKLQRPKLGEHVNINGVQKTWKRKIIYLKKPKPVKSTTVSLSTSIKSEDARNHVYNINSTIFDKLTTISSKHSDIRSKNQTTVAHSKDISVDSSTNKLKSAKKRKLIKKIIRLT